MSKEKQQSFEQYVQQLLLEVNGERIYQFTYDGKSYWLKQPERLKGFWKILKPHPQIAFQRELDKLQFLIKNKAPVPKMVCCGKDFFVLKDGGKTGSYWIADEHCSIEMKNKILIDIVDAILSLHDIGIVHGRPAVRDIIWNDGKVLFIDFESNSENKSIFKQKRDDILIFLHSLGREANLSDEQIRLVMNEFKKKLPDNIWQSLLSFIYKLRWLYYVLLPFKPIAKTDLVAVYRLFENLFYVIEKSRKSF